MMCVLEVEGLESLLWCKAGYDGYELWPRDKRLVCVGWEIPIN